MEFSTNLLLDSSANYRYQLLYTSQNYNTFYGIFGRFKIENKTLVGIDFKLINFKGNVNLGIKDIIFLGFKDELVENYFDTENKFTNISSAVFQAEVQALNTTVFFPYKINLNLIDLEDKYICIRRSLVEINPTTNNKMIFDSEFYYRDGLRSPLKYPKDFIDYKDVKENFTSLDKSPGGICPRGHSKVLLKK